MFSVTQGFVIICGDAGDGYDIDGDCGDGGDGAAGVNINFLCAFLETCVLVVKKIIYIFGF